MGSLSGLTSILELLEKYLSGISAPTPLPGSTTVAKNHVETVNATHLESSHSLSTPQVQAVLESARQHQVTLYTIIQAAWAFLLHIYSREKSVVFGSTVSGRNSNDSSQAWQDMVGLLINSLPVRVDFDDISMKVPQLLKHIKDEHLEVTQLEWTPLTAIQSAAEFGKGSGLFQSLLVFENFPYDPSKPKFIINDITIEKTNLPLTMMIELTAEKTLNLTSMWSTSHFTKPEIQRLLSQFGHAIIKISEAANLDLNVSSIDILGQNEKSMIVNSWNNTSHSFDVDGLIHEQFDDEATKHPDSIALIFDDDQITYRELNARSNQLATVLKMHYHVTVDSRVAVCLERSVELIVSLLAILKAGATYVPIDPTYPEGRQQYMIENSCSSVVITQHGLLKANPSVSVITEGNENQMANVSSLLVVNEAWQYASRLPKTSSLVSMDSKNTMYMIYTSGSTGKPKGVMVPHIGANNRMTWMKHHMLTHQHPNNVSENNNDINVLNKITNFRHHRILQKTSICFDVSVWELFLAITQGASLVLLSQGVEKEPLQLLQEIDSRNVTALHFVPSMFTAFVSANQDQIGRLNNLEYVVSSGEALTTSTSQQFQTHLPNISIVNYYGPTEASIDVSSHVFDVVCDVMKPSVPIGKCIWNTGLLILDDLMRPVPIGVPGELYIFGIGLSRGYFNRPDLTADRFVPCPFVPLEKKYFGQNLNGLRMYKTGDLCRFTSSGVIEYIGRIDFQVKLRGFRIELGEIESALRLYNGVKDSATLIKSEKTNPILVGYVVVDDPETFNTSEIRTALEKQMPSFMVPTFIVAMESFPISGSGKLDRDKMPDPSISRDQLASSYVPPRNAIEATLCEIWKNVLGLSQDVGINDNFFELGGDSIMSIQVVSRATQAGIGLTVKSIFILKTIANLSLQMGAVVQSNADQGFLTGQTPLLPSHAWFIHTQALFIPNISHFNQSEFLPFPSSIQTATATDVRQVLLHLISHHDALRLKLYSTPTETNATAVWKADLVSEPHLQYEFVDLANLVNEESQKAAMLDKLNWLKVLSVCKMVASLLLYTSILDLVAKTNYFLWFTILLLMEFLGVF